MGRDQTSEPKDLLPSRARYIYQTPSYSVKMVKAVAVLRGDSNVKGTVTFEQASEGADTTVSWNISGHDANAERGMHVHAFGDNTNGCTSAGPHFNPHQKTHGAPSDSERHVGDLGNFKTDGQGNATGSVTDKLVKLIGPESVLGRTSVRQAGLWRYWDCAVESLSPFSPSFSRSLSVGKK